VCPARCCLGWTRVSCSTPRWAPTSGTWQCRPPPRWLAVWVVGCLHSPVVGEPCGYGYAFCRSRSSGDPGVVQEPVALRRAGLCGADLDRAGRRHSATSGADRTSPRGGGSARTPTRSRRSPATSAWAGTRSCDSLAHSLRSGLSSGSRSGSRCSSSRDPSLQRAGLIRSLALGLGAVHGREQVVGGQAAVRPPCLGDRHYLGLTGEVVQPVGALDRLRSARSPGSTMSSRCRAIARNPSAVQRPTPRPR
jgi:hypothetical protein